MTNAEKIRNMIDEQLVEFLNDWTWEKASEAFGDKYCSKCEPVIADYNGRETEFAKCEFDDYVCPHEKGDCVKWWLQEECDTIPAADMREVKHGKWQITEYDYYDCSVCGNSYYNGCDSSAEARQKLDERSPDVYKYCPHCGAKMDGEI